MTRRDIDEALAAELAAGASQTEAARRLGVSARTVRRRLEESSFQARVRALRAARVQQIADRLGGAATAAVATLERLLSAGSESVQLGAARALLDAALGWRQAGELEERIAAVETALAQPPTSIGPAPAHRQAVAS